MNRGGAHAIRDGSGGTPHRGGRVRATGPDWPSGRNPAKIDGVIHLSDDATGSGRCDEGTPRWQFRDSSRNHSTRPDDDTKTLGAFAGVLGGDAWDDILPHRSWQRPPRRCVWPWSAAEEGHRSRHPSGTDSSRSTRGRASRTTRGTGRAPGPGHPHAPGTHRTRSPLAHKRLRTPGVRHAPGGRVRGRRIPCQGRSRRCRCRSAGDRRRPGADRLHGEDGSS